GIWLAPPITAQTKPSRPAATGTLAGSVTAQSGEVRALRVRAMDTAHKIAYTVFTQKGQYHIFNVPTGTYDLQVMEEEWNAPVQKVTVAEGQTQSVNLAVTPRATSPDGIERVDFDVLYPPGPGRDLLVRRCFGCHGLAGDSKGSQAGWHFK